MRREAVAGHIKIGPGDGANRPGTVAQEVVAPMHSQSIKEGSKEFDRLDGAILGLLIEPENQRPWTEAEIGRAITLAGDVPASLKRLRRSGLIHRWHGMASASRAAIRMEDATQSDGGPADFERRHESLVLEVLLGGMAPTETPMSEKEIRRALNLTNDSDKLAVYDALSRLDGAGLVDRHGGLVFATAAAVHFDRVMDL